MPDYSLWIEGLPTDIIFSAEKDLRNPLGPSPLEQFQWGLGLVDAATVSSARLADDWSQYTNCYELPDYLNTCQYPISETDHENEIWIGFGADTQSASLKNSGLAAALEHICRVYPQVRLVACHQENCPHPQLDIDPEKIIHQSPQFFDEWVSILLKLDIGLIPIHGNYDLRLSQANMLEFMIAKIPWVATEQPAFHNLLQYGHWVQNSPEDWECAILDTINQLDAYQRKTNREPFLFALGQDVSANIEKVLKVYSAIINH
jgi:hypothetical protein